MPVRTDRPWLLIAIAGLVLALFARADSADRVSKFRRSTANPTFIGVMGAVRQPGVYELSSTNPALWEVVQRSGGLSPGARGAVRIIRNGRVAGHTHVATGMRTTLQPGDVVVISGTRNTGRRQTVEIAIVGLLDRPVVLRLRPEHANLPRLVDLLGQSKGAQSAVRVISRSGGRNRGTAIARHSVLVFDPRVIHSDRIPPLPKPVLLQPQSRRSVHPQPRSRNVLPTSMERISEEPNRPPRILRSTPPRNSEAAGTFTQVDPDGPPGTHNAVDPASEPSGLRGMFQMPRNGESETAALSSLESSEAPAGSGADTDLVAKADAYDRAGPQSQASIAPLTMIVGVFAVMGVLGAAALLWFTGRRVMRGQTDANSAVSKRTRLQRLLDDELEICEEPLVMPTALEFFGRPGGMPKLRADAASTINGPHFAPADAPVNEPVQPPSGRRSDLAEATPPQPASVATPMRSDVHHEEVR